jgi:hypothetical protein
MDDLRGKFGFWHCSVIPYFLQQNGAVERHVREAKRMIFKTIHGDTAEWEKAVLLVQRDINNCIIKRHGSRPFAILFGRKMNGLRDYQGETSVTTNEHGLEEKARELREVVFPAIEKRLKEEGEKQCKEKEKGLEKGRRFKPGDVVMKKRDGMVSGIQAP